MHVLFVLRFFFQDVFPGTWNANLANLNLGVSLNIWSACSKSLDLFLETLDKKLQSFDFNFELNDNACLIIVLVCQIGDLNLELVDGLEMRIDCNFQDGDLRLVGSFDSLHLLQKLVVLLTEGLILDLPGLVLLELNEEVPVLSFSSGQPFLVDVDDDSQTVNLNS